MSSQGAVIRGRSSPRWSRVLTWPVRTPVGRSVVLLALDMSLAASALLLALVLRFEGQVPGDYARAAWVALPGLAAIRLTLSVLFQLHRWSFRLAGLNEAAKLTVAAAVGTALFMAVGVVTGGKLLPRSVYALEFFLTTGAMALVRFGPRVFASWAAEQRRSRSDQTVRTLILGAGSAGDLLLRDIQRSPLTRYNVVGFLDDDPQKLGTSLDGKPVLGTLEELPAVAKKYGVKKVLIAIPRIDPATIRGVLRACSSLKLGYKIIPASFAYFDRRLTAAMLNDLSPEDLLPREKVDFDPQEIRQHLKGKRVLVTGAAGSIGSEIARQVASHAPESLVLVDMNENELYLLSRSLEAKYPKLAIHALIADIREERRMVRMGQEHRPHFVFHAAAHKHVPLMETSPEEAIKNNVLGTLHVARMADKCGAERFVLISTDKAVRPSSVMGASKRAAELVVRAVAEKSRTKFTSVRFGNVLGSAGSVVPLFKQQIQRGGPVTVTHPDCTRYFMTIPEAVGLVLLSGLGGYGELCVLDMGEPIRISELASDMITMAGLVPGRDIQITYTGLRPGEKLAEELLTEEEEQTQTVRGRIMVAKPGTPPPDLYVLLEGMRQAAMEGDSERALGLLAELVPNSSLRGASSSSSDFTPPPLAVQPVSPPPVSYGTGHGPLRVVA